MILTLLVETIESLGTKDLEVIHDVVNLNHNLFLRPYHIIQVSVSLGKLSILSLQYHDSSFVSVLNGASSTIQGGLQRRLLLIFLFFRL